METAREPIPERLYRPEEDEEAPIAQPADYAPETEAGVEAGPEYVNQEGALPDMRSSYRESPDGQIVTRMTCMNYAVQSLGPERADSGADWAADTIRRAERFRKYILTGAQE